MAKECTWTSEQTAQEVKEVLAVYRRNRLAPFFPTGTCPAATSDHRTAAAQMKCNGTYCATAVGADPDACATEPVFQPRGTPISVYHRLQVLSDLGYAIDLVTYPLGEPAIIPQVRVLHVWRPWGLKHIKIGPSAVKVLLNLFVAVLALGCLLRRRYAAIHTHEEAVFIGALYAQWFRLPHLYDMHSSLPQQFENWRVMYAPVITGIGRSLERWAIRRSDVVVTVCQALTDYVQALAPNMPQVLIENLPSVRDSAPNHDGEAVRRQYCLASAPLWSMRETLSPTKASSCYSPASLRCTVPFLTLVSCSSAANRPPSSDTETGQQPTDWRKR